MKEYKLEARKERYKKLKKELEKEFKNAKLALVYKNEWELMVAVQLSAQSTDKKVNEIMPVLSKKFLTIKSYKDADILKLQEAVNQVLYYRNKARNIKECAKQVIENFDSKIPNTMKELLTLKGVARKTANVLLGTLFGIKEGIVVDTHMIRFSRRFDLTDYKDAVKIEKDLMQIIPKRDWYKISYMVVNYGRKYGNPRAKKEVHELDKLIKIYPKAKNYWPK